MSLGGLFRSVALVGHAVALVGVSVALVGVSVALVGLAVALVKVGDSQGGRLFHPWERAQGG